MAPDADEACERGRPLRELAARRGFDRGTASTARSPINGIPSSYRDNQPIERPAGGDYHLTEDLVDPGHRLRRQSQVAAPERPYFLYLALGACHWPHHVPQALIDKYQGRYDSRLGRYSRGALGEAEGDSASFPRDTELPPGNPGVPAWAASARTSAGSASAHRKSMPASSNTPTSRSAAWCRSLRREAS